MYEIRQAASNDWPTIAPFIDRNHGSSAPFKQQPRWLCSSDNPYWPAADNRMPAWLAVAAGEVARQLAMQQCRLHVSGEAVAMGWIAERSSDRTCSSHQRFKGCLQARHD